MKPVICSRPSPGATEPTGLGDAPADSPIVSTGTLGCTFLAQNACSHAHNGVGAATMSMSPELLWVARRVGTPLRSPERILWPGSDVRARGMHSADAARSAAWSSMTVHELKSAESEKEPRDRSTPGSASWPGSVGWKGLRSGAWGLNAPSWARPVGRLTRPEAAWVRSVTGPSVG